MRRKKKIKRNIVPDVKYNDITVTKFINYLMRGGKKSVARRVFYNCFDILAKKSKKDPLEVFKRAVVNAAPMLEVKSRRIGGAHYQVPHEVRGERQQTLAFRWIIQAAKSAKGKPMSEKLANELLAASKNQGTAIKKKDDTYRMAEANKAFAHFAR